MKEELYQLLSDHGQEHVLAFWDSLLPVEREALAEEIRAIDFELLESLYASAGEETDWHALADRAGPPRAFRLDTTRNPFSPEQACRRAGEALSAGRMGVVLVAGGQGSRLGFDHPKGMFPIGPVSGKSLFQIHLEKIVALSRQYGAPVPLYLMTSPATHEETVAFLQEHDRFGLPEEDLNIFCQGTMPAVDAETGKLILAQRHALCLSPDGHGGMLQALSQSGYLEEMSRRGIEHLFYFQVDNPLVDIGDEEFLGYHLLSDSELSSQVIAKRDPLEKVGNVVEVDGRLRIIEYSDLPDEAARRRNPDGSLVIWAGSIAVHAMEVAFLRRMADRADALPFHVARKKVPHLTPSGQWVDPKQPNAIKFERFIFDLLPSARNAVVVEVDPKRRFAPLKNASGEKQDTPEAVRAQMAAEHADWLRRAGAEVEDEIPVEISPLFARNAGQLAKKIPPGLRVNEPRYFC